MSTLSNLCTDRESNVSNADDLPRKYDQVIFESDGLVSRSQELLQTRVEDRDMNDEMLLTSRYSFFPGISTKASALFYGAGYGELRLERE